MVLWAVTLMELKVAFCFSGIKRLISLFALFLLVILIYLLYGSPFLGDLLVYMPPIPEKRPAFWDSLHKLYKLRNHLNKPWLVGGDFNDILFDSEKMGGNKRRGPCINNFRNCCHNLGIFDIKAMGSMWTWTNGRKGKARICEKLDHFLANTEWENLFPRAQATNCSFFGSDHRAVKLSVNLRKWVPKHKPCKPFIFENKWILENGFIDNVKQFWDSTAPAKTLPEKLSICGDLVSKWAEKVGNTKKKIAKLSKEIDSLQAIETEESNIYPLQKSYLCKRKYTGIRELKSIG